MCMLPVSFLMYTRPQQYTYRRMCCCVGVHYYPPAVTTPSMHPLRGTPGCRGGAAPAAAAPLLGIGVATRVVAMWRGGASQHPHTGAGTCPTLLLPLLGMSSIRAGAAPTLVCLHPCSRQWVVCQWRAGGGCGWRVALPAPWAWDHPGCGCPCCAMCLPCRRPTWPVGGVCCTGPALDAGHVALLPPAAATCHTAARAFVRVAPCALHMCPPAAATRRSALRAVGRRQQQPARVCVAAHNHCAVSGGQGGVLELEGGQLAGLSWARATIAAGVTRAATSPHKEGRVGQQSGGGTGGALCCPWPAQVEQRSEDVQHVRRGPPPCRRIQQRRRQLSVQMYMLCRPRLPAQCSSCGEAGVYEGSRPAQPAPWCTSGPALPACGRHDPERRGLAPSRQPCQDCDMPTYGKKSTGHWRHGAVGAPGDKCVTPDIANEEVCAAQRRCVQSIVLITTRQLFTVTK
jgi:hypothetical protein